MTAAPPPSLAPSPIDESRQRVDLARDMIEVHGPGAAQVARENARAAAVGGQALEARRWLRTLDIIQQLARSSPPS
jgi:hypothetical protein